MSAVEQLYSADIVEIVLDLPMPPSTNRIWRSARGRVFKSKAYLDWMTAADVAVLANRQYPRNRKIHGPFEAVLFFANTNRGDGDNRIKPVLDWCQSRDVIWNDSDCRSGHWAWVSPDQAPSGCRVTLRSLHG